MSRRDSRRELLRAIGRGLKPASVVGALAGYSAVAYGKYPTQREFETITGYDNATAELDRYRPYFDLSGLDIRPTDLYCWRTTSTERETTMLSYWAWYPAGQSGVSSEDSHVPDREPVVVEVNPDTEEVVAVYYDAIHYSVGRLTAPTLTDGDHPVLRVVKPWHNYEPLADADAATADPDLADLTDIYGAWVDNDWSVHRRSVVAPWEAASRGHWWPDTAGGRFNNMLTGIIETTGFDFLRDT
jgi:hypothetical protein